MEKDTIHEHSKGRTRRWLARTLLALPTLALVGTAAAGVAHGAATSSPNDPHLVDVEITDDASSKPQTMRISLAVDAHGRSMVYLPVGDLNYSITAKVDPPAHGETMVPTRLDVHRTDPHPGSPQRFDVAVDTALAIGARVTIATIARPDGTKIEIAARLR